MEPPAAAPQAPVVGQGEDIPHGPHFPPTRRGWHHYAATVDLLVHQQRFKQTPQLDLFQLGSDALVTGGQVIGRIFLEKVSTTWDLPPVDALVDNLLPDAASRPRYLEKVYSVLAAIIEDETCAQPILLKALEHSCGLFESSAPTLRLHRPYFYAHVLPCVQKALVLQLSSLPDELKTRIYRVRAEFAEKEIDGLSAGDPEAQLIAQLSATSRTQDYTRVELFAKIAALKQREATVALVTSLRTSTGSSDLARAALDFFLQLQTSQPNVSVAATAELFKQLSQCVAQVAEDDRAALFAKLVETLRVRVAVAPFAAAANLFTTTIIPLYSAKRGSVALSAKILSRALEAYAVAAEAGLSIDDVITQSFQSASDLAAQYEPSGESVQIRLIDLCVRMLRSRASPEVLRRGADPMVGFMNNCPGLVNRRNPQAFLLALELGSLLVERRLEPASFVSFWANMAPKPFGEMMTWRLTDEERQECILRVLEWSVVTIRSGINFFKIYVLYFPFLLNGIGTLPAPLSQSGVLRAISLLCQAKADAGDDVGNVLAEGIPMLLKISPCTEESFRSLTDNLLERFDSSESYGLVLRLTHSWKFVTQHFPAQPKAPEELFLLLIRKGSWQDVRLVYDVFRGEVAKEKYAPVINLVLAEIARGANLREIRAMFSMLWSILSMNVHKENENIPFLTQHLLQEMEANVTDKQKRGSVDKNLSRLILYKTLSREFLAQQHTEQEVLDSFKAFQCPDEVLADEDTMYALSLLGKRIEHTRRECQKRIHVANMAADCLKLFLADLPGDAPSDPSARLQLRKQRLDTHIHNMDANVALRTHLLALGFSPSLWTAELQVQVEIDSTRDFDSLLAKSLAQLYVGYTDILREGNVSEVEHNGQREALETLFQWKDSVPLQLEDVRGRRNSVIAALNQLLAKTPVGADKDKYVAKRTALLAQEKELEAQNREDKRKARSDKSQRQHLWARFNKRFLAVLSTTDAHITGCYAPEGDHAEKLIENGLKANTGIISVYEAKRTTSVPAAAVPKGQKGGTQADKDKANDVPEIGGEIENIEVIFTDQGMFCYKIYTNGHKRDTSLAWLQMLKELVTQRLVPAIIVPANFPSPRVFSLLANFIPPQIYSSVITYKDSFFDSFNVESYYDLKPEKIKQGDIMITADNCHLLDPSQSPGKAVLLSSTGLEKQREGTAVSGVRLRKDLGGAITQEVMRRLKSDAFMESYKETLNVFGRCIAQYVSAYLERGAEDSEVLAAGFDIDTWNRRKTKNAKRITVEEKNSLVKHIVEVIAKQIQSFYAMAPAELFALDRDHFFELKNHLEMLATRPAFAYRPQLREMRELLRGRSDMVAMHSQPTALQQEVLRWIFRNEDKVWRDRGGRPGEETVEMFLDFMKPDPKAHFNHVAFPGVILLSAPISSATPVEVVAYAIGDFESADSYEVITAWTAENYRNMNLAMTMYFRILSEFHARQEHVKYIVCDTIKGGYEKMISSSPVLVALRKIHLLSWVIRKRVDSYTTELDHGGEEKFERIVIYAPLLTLMLRTYLGSERVWKLLGHKIDPQFRRLVTAPANPATKKSWTGLFVLGAAVAIGFGAGGYFFQDRIRAAFPAQQ